MLDVEHAGDTSESEAIDLHREGGQASFGWVALACGLRRGAFATHAAPHPLTACTSQAIFGLIPGLLAVRTGKHHASIHHLHNVRHSLAHVRVVSTSREW